MTQDFSFQYPAGLVGFHSGWNENEKVTAHLSLTHRRDVTLAELGHEVIKLYGDGERPPFLVKQVDGEKEGLSCGAGSALYRHNGETLKIKRAGFKYKGFVDRYIPDRKLCPGETFLDSTEYQHAGSMDISDAEQEIRAQESLTEDGFCVPQQAVALYKIHLPFGTTDDGALISKVDSDLRIDEYVFSMLCSKLADMKQDGIVDFNSESETFTFKPVSCEEMNEKYFEEIRDQLHTIGNNIGCMYAQLHDLGYVRGVGNAWYGNEIMMPDGTIGLCDFESTYVPGQVKNKIVLETFQESDINLARTAIYSSIVPFENFFFDLAANTLIKGFEAGYKSKKEKKIHAQDLEANIKEFLEKKQGLFGEHYD